MAEFPFAELEAVLGHTFHDRGLLERALRHATWCNEQPAPRPDDNQRLEFIGDAVLGLAVGHRLMQRFPAGTERDLSVTRQQLVSETALSASARRLAIGTWLMLGKGEQKSGGRDKPKLLADALEALIGAVFLDAGFEVARDTVDRLLAVQIANVELKNFHDFKSRLQEIAQQRLKATPVYRVVHDVGEGNEKQFVVAVTIAGEEWARAPGHSKKEAEQRAAAEAHLKLEGRDDGGPHDRR